MTAATKLKDAPRERPILLKDEMVRAILEGRKTQTRRVAKGVSGEGAYPFWLGTKYGGAFIDRDNPKNCPIADPGDRLWVKETFVYRHKHDRYYYRADHPVYDPYAHNGWKPSIFMPRAASRITLPITSVRVERLRDISEEDAKAEGVELSRGEAFGLHSGLAYSVRSAREGFRFLWESINGAESWDANHWVWVITWNKAEVRR